MNVQRIKKNIQSVEQKAMSPIRFKIIEAFGFLCQETCIILYWMGLWSLLQNFTPLLDSIVFNLFCFLFGAVGLFVVKAIAPALILKSIEESSSTLYRSFPAVRKDAIRDVRSSTSQERHGAKVAR